MRETSAGIVRTQKGQKETDIFSIPGKDNPSNSLLFLPAIMVLSASWSKPLSRETPNFTGKDIVPAEKSADAGYSLIQYFRIKKAVADSSVLGNKQVLKRLFGKNDGCRFSFGKNAEIFPLTVPDNDVFLDNFKNRGAVNRFKSLRLLTDKLRV